MAKKRTKPARPKRTAVQRLTRFGRYLREHEISPLALADATGVSRQHLCRLRFGAAEPTRQMMIVLTVGVRQLRGGWRRVRLTELFDLGGEGK